MVDVEEYECDSADDVAKQVAAIVAAFVVVVAVAAVEVARHELVAEVEPVDSKLVAGDERFVGAGAALYAAEDVEVAVVGADYEEPSVVDGFEGEDVVGVEGAANTWDQFVVDVAGDETPLVVGRQHVVD